MTELYSDCNPVGDTDTGHQCDICVLIHTSIPDVVRGVCVTYWNDTDLWVRVWYHHFTAVMPLMSLKPMTLDPHNDSRAQRPQNRVCQTPELLVSMGGDLDVEQETE